MKGGCGCPPQARRACCEATFRAEPNAPTVFARRAFFRRFSPFLAGCRRISPLDAPVFSARFRRLPLPGPDGLAPRRALPWRGGDARGRGGLAPAAGCGFSQAAEAQGQGQDHAPAGCWHGWSHHGRQTQKDSPADPQSPRPRSERGHRPRAGEASVFCKCHRARECVGFLAYVPLQAHAFSKVTTPQAAPARQQCVPLPVPWCQAKAPPRHFGVKRGASVAGGLPSP